ncbi:MnhB domain-containing protein [Microbulbifer agarilyticus]|uniref:MnhB domain-containing protein n=1 Tax=Microbulbifer agarilyticus TaxID=260552 RepID=UPI001CD1EDDD|nr:MnhB domain-containing protein [Microbulbifer agarilyticus]MCA0899675.1 Na(+)/H(+) antiporter subunit B [Microbulbifer agarilyticus]
MSSVILQGTTRLLVALILLFSVYMLMRGHNLPGGGFIAGLIASAAFVLYALAWSLQEARAALRVSPVKLAAIGALLSLASAVPGLLKGFPPFTGLWLFIGGGEGDKGIPISTVLLFDVGIYLAVLGAVLALFFTIEVD